MSEELDDLYREVILDHSKNPRNFRAMADATRSAEGHNRLCGDRLMLYVKVADGVIQDLSFQGKGCAINTAAASMMTEALKGKSVTEAETLFHRFHDVLTGGPDEITEMPDLGKLAVFQGVRRFPVRVKCATLPWHTLVAALKDEQAPVSTE
jgi:nitrogen fixation NifU-like protein